MNRVMSDRYVELHGKSFYSFGEGASHVHELATRAVEYGQPALALTDANLCGALEFANLAGNLRLKPVTGGELTLTDGSRLTLLAKSRAGYSNLSQLFTLANSRDRREPRLDPVHLPSHTDGLIALAGGRDGRLSRLLIAGRYGEVKNYLGQIMDWFGPDSVYVELQRNLLEGEARRNRRLAALAGEMGVPPVATNGTLYHTPERYKLQHALVAIANNSTIDRSLEYILPNDQFYLKSDAEMMELFADCPKAVANTLEIAERCEFDLSSDLGYTLPEPDVPEGYTPMSYLVRLCYEAAVRRYGSVTEQVEERLQEEFRLIERNGMAGFLLLYREIALLGREIMEERGMVGPEIALEERPPGRGRGSSVALLAGYLVGISHVDPLKWDLTLERFISEDADSLPDIDLDFPRAIMDELIERVHRRFGPACTVLTGAVSTYRSRGVIRDLGAALGLPEERLKLLAGRMHDEDMSGLAERMGEMPEFRESMKIAGWRNLAELAPQLIGAPKSLGQHVGGMILSSSPIPEMVPVRAGAMEGRYIMDWDKDSVADAGFAKIDILSLPVLDQIEEALGLIERSGRERLDMSRLDPEDAEVYDMINEGRCKGVFLLQSPAQLKLARRLLSRNLLDLAYQVALIRPGVGAAESAVSKFVDRYRYGAGWGYDHPLEERALARGYGIIVWQEQVVQLLMDVGGMSASEADGVRRAFAKSNNGHLVAMHRRRFLDGALNNGVDKETALKVFEKVNGQYMFPESHSHAFAITAYQAAWLKRHYPLEFFVALMNNQPMGFYPVETLKQDARRFGVPFLNPCVNGSEPKAIPENGSVLLGLGLVKDVGPESARLIVEEREERGPYIGAGDLVRRSGLRPQAVESLVMAGAFDRITPNRRQSLWDAGLYASPKRNGQAALPLSMEDSIPNIADFPEAERMAGEYRAMGIYPRGHLMQFVRPNLSSEVMTCAEVERLGDEDFAVVAGWPIARQHPKGRDGTIFVTLEDETGDTQVILWPRVYAEYRRELSSQVVMVRGRISAWDGTVNLIVSEVRAIRSAVRMPRSHDWR